MGSKITLVIPTYTINPELEEMAIVAALTYRSQVDELIIAEDGGNHSAELASVADLYLYSKKNEGFTRNVNKGWLLSTGEYTMIVNSDTQLMGGDLNDLCIPGKVTCPITHTENVPYFWGAFFCVPKEIEMERGMLDERLRMYGSDTDYERRIKDIYQPVQTVEILHGLGKTTQYKKQEMLEQQERDRKEYERICQQSVS